MKRTGPTPVLILALVGAVAGFLVELSLVSSGKPILVAPLSLPVTLVVIAAIMISLAIPIRRATHGNAKARIDPFRALRIAVLAKASSLSGALLVGVTLGMLVYMLTLKVLPSSSSVSLAVGALIGAVVLLVGGLIAEHMCTLPPDDQLGEENHAGQA